MAPRPELLETPHAQGFIGSPAPGNLSFENVIAIDGETLRAGEVLGMRSSDGQYAALDLVTAGGLEVAAGISLNDVAGAAGETPKVAILKRSSTVNLHELVWPDGFTQNQIDAAVAQLAVLDIISRG